ncbi:phage tail protein [Citrobacter braakii]|uniref:phage tail protein n=2 Tax=Citrobacter braakii TaxID=57706 RepID=UPI00201B5012|nr:phage tail protein [Citrobacter braakii]
MHRIDTPTAQKDKFGAGKNGFTAGNPQTGTPATDLDNDYFDMLQEELAGVVEATGVNLDKSKHNQLLTALKALMLIRAHPFADIKADGPAAIAEALSNLRLERFQQADDATRIFSPDSNVYLRIDNTGWYVARKNSGKIPASIDAGGTGATTAKDAVYNLGLGAGAPAIGIPFFWPLAAMPNTVMDEWSDMVFLKPNGASFSAATYPKLAKVWTGLVIPDMRGEFPRIWDDGRGVDRGRALLSYQGDASRNITGSFGGTTNNDTCSVLGNGAGVFANGTSLTTPTNGSVIGSATRPVTMTLDISRQVPTAEEFRSRNIALNFLVRAK